MKTPREILFERHHSAEPKLDAIRQTILDRGRRRAESDSRAGSLVQLIASAAALRGLLRSVRWHLAGLSAAWLVAAFLNIDPSSASAPPAATQHPASPRQILTALREHRRQLLELIGSSLTEPVPAPRTLTPRRRGELQSATALA